VGETYKSLEGKRIIVTRAAEQSESLLQSLRENNAVPVLLPMVSFSLPDDTGPLDDAIQNLGEFDWMFLTSQNALRALENRCGYLHVILREIMADVQIAAVGPATSEAALSRGLQVAYVAKKHQGTALAEELSAVVGGKKILLPRSDRANPDLVQALERLGAVVTDLVAYKTVRPTEAENANYISEIERGANAILFFSPSAVHNLQDMLGAARFVVLSRTMAYSAIGPVTERALRETGVSRIVAAADTNVAAVLQALDDHFSTTPVELPAGAKHA
jgi:uroporphyrinogen III methyltransferase/synthase